VSPFICRKNHGDTSMYRSLETLVFFHIFSVYITLRSNIGLHNSISSMIMHAIIATTALPGYLINWRAKLAHLCD